MGLAEQTGGGLTYTVPVLYRRKIDEEGCYLSETVCRGNPEVIGYSDLEHCHAHGGPCLCESENPLRDMEVA
jgi:hypothetical protein